MSKDQIIYGPNGDVLIVGTGAGNMRAIAPDAPAIEISDPITAIPDVSGEHGKAWLCNLEEGRKQMGVRVENDATLAHWIIEAPWAHPAWHSYSLVLVHLREMPGNPRTMFYKDGATHELWLYAFDPTMDRNRVIASGIVKGCWLQPKNFAAQFVEISDELAMRRVRDAVSAICNGRLSPDTDHQNAWAEMFGDNMMKDRPNRRPPHVRGE